MKRVKIEEYLNEIGLDKEAAKLGSGNKSSSAGIPISTNTQQEEIVDPYSKQYFKTKFSDAYIGKVVTDNLTINKNDLEDKEKINVVTDIFSFLYKQIIETNEECTYDKDTKKAMDLLFSNEQVLLIRDNTTMNTVRSALATEELIKLFARIRKDIKNTREENNSCSNANNNNKDNKNNENKGKANEGGNDEEENNNEDNKISSKISSKAKEISDTIEAAKHIEDCITGGGFSPGGNKSDSSELNKLKLKQSISSVLANKTVMDKLIQELGRLKSIAYSTMANRAAYELDDDVETKLSNDLKNILPLELCKLFDNDLELDFLKRFSSNELLCRDRENLSDLGKGPVIIAIDESGSMDHVIYNAKAIALATAWAASQQERDVHIVRFSSLVDSFDFNENNHYKISNFINEFYGGGTNIIGALHCVKKLLEKDTKYNKADILIITDFEIDWNVILKVKKYIQDIKKLAKKTRVRLIHIVHPKDKERVSKMMSVKNMAELINEADSFLLSTDLYITYHTARKIFDL